MSDRHPARRSDRSLPAGIIFARRAQIARLPALAFTNIVQTIPSLALFGFLLPVPLIGGIGKRTAIVALVLYALLPILRNTVTGILGVDQCCARLRPRHGNEQPISSSGKWNCRWRRPTIMAGIRIATVSTIATATIAAAIGGGGLGTFIFRGIAMVDSRTVLAGAVPAAIIALVADGGLTWLERKLSSWS